ncbi:MAG: hypothetical protein WC875_05715 [Candidatus Absconditabacterales bacterium]
MTSIYDQATFQNVILTILACVILAVVLGCLYTFIRAIFFFIFSGAKEENKKKGWNSIRFMIIGVILTIVLLFLVPTVLKWMNVPKYNVYTPKNIFNKAGGVVNYIFNLGNVIKESQLQNEYRGNMYYDTTPDVQEPSSDGYQL